MFQAQDKVERDFWYSTICRTQKALVDSSPAKGSRVAELASYLDKVEVRFGAPEEAC